MFAVPFDEIAPMAGRSPTATRQLASRARRRVQGQAPVRAADLTRQREVVDTFLAAARECNFDAVVAVLDPDVALHADGGSAWLGASRDVRAATAVAPQALTFSQPGRRLQPAAPDVASISTSARLSEPAGRTTGTITPVEVSLCAYAITSASGSNALSS